MLIDGCERDLMQYHYESFDDLKDYCYSVASVVGLMCIEIFGYKYEDLYENDKAMGTKVILSIPIKHKF